MEAALDLLLEISNPFKCLFAGPEQSSNQVRRSKPLPDLPLEIWLEIFQFATYVHQHVTIVPLDPFSMKRVSTNVMGVNTPTLSMRTKLSLVLVCRSWRRISVQMLYEHLVIRSPARANAILSVLRNSAQRLQYDDRETGKIYSFPGYGMWTRHVEIFTHARGAHDIRYLQSIFHILQVCPNLRTLSGTWVHPLPLEFLNAIAILYGPSLEALYWGELTTFPTITTPEFLGSFQSLRVLDLRNYVGNEFVVGSETSPRISSLPKVQHLIMSTHSRSVAVATALSLPSLRNLTIKTMSIKTNTSDLLLAFLKVHGRSLICIDLPSPSVDSDPDPDTAVFRRSASHLNPDIFLRPDLCPNLDTFTFPTISPPLGTHVHHSIRRIGLRGVRAESLYPDKTGDKGSGTKGHLLSFTPAKYPNLEVVKTVGFLVDADSDSLIKDVFIWWVEKFEKQGIDFLDGEGVLWAYADASISSEPKGRSARSPFVSAHTATIANNDKKVDLFGNSS
ncbi:hypothetical protein BDZ94DRAFT_1283038 [Collybia nuda]|uniref:F-box domain-containing protein n=1 Tax=Collybia nuda TaxID=64659 RepID=A0A9P6CE10_9AGAR|nr:hypothetical protein BDZ94DRAFT_1283038 [Collybia nuda]